MHFDTQVFTLTPKFCQACLISIYKSSNDFHVENPKEKPAFDGPVSNCFCSEEYQQFLMDGLQCNLVLMTPVGSRCSRHIDLITFYALWVFVCMVEPFNHIE